MGNIEIYTYFIIENLKNTGRTFQFLLNNLYRIKLKKLSFFDLGPRLAMRGIFFIYTNLKSSTHS